MRKYLTLFLLIGCCEMHAQTIIFADGFNYSNGTLDGNNGGTGWAGAWTNGSSSVTSNIPGRTGSSVRVADNASITSRIFNTPITIGLSTNYYLSFFFNANTFSTSPGDYAGINLTDSDPSTNSDLFIGMPGSSGTLGFSWQNEGEELIGTATSSTTYLVLVKIEAHPISNTLISMFVTTNLSSSGSAMESSLTPISLSSSVTPTYNTIEIAGGYPITSTINIAGLAMATTANATVSRTQMGAPLFGNTQSGESVDICQQGTYFLNPSTTTGTWGTTSSTIATVNSTGYVTGLSPGTATITYTVDGETTTALINVLSADTFSPSTGSFTDSKTAFKFNGNPQGPLNSAPAVNYVGYDGYTYAAQTAPSSVGFYKASIQLGNRVGCPYSYYIFACPTCPDL